MNYETIKPYIEKKLISEQPHPDYPNIRIFNYTQHCQFEGAWDEVTKQCRGLILNVETGEIIARPFPKFFNYGEYISKGWTIPNGIPKITEKLDGSLGILYQLEGNKRAIATRGSFVSEQAQWATKWFNENLADVSFSKEKTYLFEIIYPENRIVVNYNFSALILLEMIDTKTGVSEQPHVVALEEPKKLIFVKQVPPTDLENLAKMDFPNSEGFVIKYPDDTRIKIKFPEYVRLHKVMTGLSEIGIWEHLRATGSLADTLENVPDEFFEWVKKIEQQLRTSFNIRMTGGRAAMIEVRDLPTRKEKALWINENAKDFSSIAFLLLDEKVDQACDAAWRMIRPKGQSIYKVDIDA